MFEIGLTHYLVVSALLFGLGVINVASRRNAIGILLGIELILNAANLNFLAFAHYVDGGITGHVFSIFVITMAAAEAAISLAIVIGIFNYYRTIHVDLVATMRH